MQTPFITDLRAKALPIPGEGIPAAALTIQYLDHDGRHVGTSIIAAGDLAQHARDLLALCEAATLHAAGADGARLPPVHHFPIMRDVRIGSMFKLDVTTNPRPAIGPRGSVADRLHHPVQMSDVVTEQRGREGHNDVIPTVLPERQRDEPLPAVVDQGPGFEGVPPVGGNDDLAHDSLSCGSSDTVAADTAASIGCDA